MVHPKNRSCEQRLPWDMFYVLGVGSVYGDVHAGDHWEDDETDTIIDEVTRFVIRFVDRVGTVAGISTDHLKSLYSLVPSRDIFLCVF